MGAYATRYVPRISSESIQDQFRTDLTRSQNKIFSNPNNLKKHLKIAHDLEYAPHVNNTLSSIDNQNTVRTFVKIQLYFNA